MFECEGQVGERKLHAFRPRFYGPARLKSEGAFRAFPRDRSWPSTTRDHIRNVQIVRAEGNSR